jgi:hypothetical protein
MDESRGTRRDVARPAPDRPPHQSGGEREETPDSAASRLFWPWLRFWVQMAVLAVLAITGLFFASRGRQPGDYQSGLMLAAAALALAVLLVKRRIDGAPDDLASLALVDDTRALAFVIPPLALAALAGLVIARIFPTGTRHLFGLGLFGAGVLAILLQIKHAFDRLDRGKK